MEETTPIIPDYTEAFRRALRQGTLSEERIEAFIAIWKALPPGTPKLPCPLCYVSSGWGALNPVPEKRDGVDYVRCARCKNEIAV